MIISSADSVAQSQSVLFCSAQSWASALTKATSDGCGSDRSRRCALAVCLDLLCADFAMGTTW